MLNYEVCDLMPFHKWKTLTSKILQKNPWWAYQLDTFETPHGYRGEYHYVHTEGASLVIPVLDDGRILLVRQYRYLGDRDSLEFPCGGVKSGTTYEETAAEELAQEAGYSAGSLNHIATFNPYNGVTDELCRVYVARMLARSQSHPDDTEEFERVVMTAAELEARIASGEIWDGMTLAAWSVARDRLQIGDQS